MGDINGRKPTQFVPKDNAPFWACLSRYPAESLHFFRALKYNIDCCGWHTSPLATWKRTYPRRGCLHSCPVLPSIVREVLGSLGSIVYPGMILLGGIVCMVFREVARGIMVRTLVLQLGLIRARDREWIFHCFCFFLKVTNTFVMASNLSEVRGYSEGNTGQPSEIATTLTIFFYRTLSPQLTVSIT